MLKLKAVGRNQLLGERVKHERVIGIGRVAKGQIRFLHGQKSKQPEANCHAGLAATIG
jgi:hypothetical protein